MIAYFFTLAFMIYLFSKLFNIKSTHLEMELGKLIIWMN
jgi:hypothetical protein